MTPAEYEAEKERVADSICERLEAVFPGLRGAIEFREVSAVAGLRGWGGWGGKRGRLVGRKGVF